VNKILVSGASGIVGYGILRSLKRSGKKLSLIGTSIYDDSVAQGFCDIFEQAPLTNDASYIEWLLDTIRKHRVDLIIPGIEIDLYKWVEHVSEIERAGATVLLNNIELIHFCKDKWAFYKKLKQFNTPFAIETTLDTDFKTLAARFDLPFLLKPRQGYGARGIVHIDSPHKFSMHKREIGSVLMAQPIVGNDNEEFSASAFCDGQGGFYASMAIRRKLSKDGFTEKAEVVFMDEINDALSVLCGCFNPIGPTNFQFRKHEGGLKLLEINPRISSSTSIRSAFGYDESKMAIEFYLENKKPMQPAIKAGRAVRYTEDFIFYENRTDL